MPPAISARGRLCRQRLADPSFSSQSMTSLASGWSSWRRGLGGGAVGGAGVLTAGGVALFRVVWGDGAVSAGGATLVFTSPAAGGGVRAG